MLPSCENDVETEDNTRTVTFLSLLQTSSSFWSPAKSYLTFDLNACEISCFLGGSDGKESICLQCRSPEFDPCKEDPLEKGIATLSSILAWRIPVDRGVWQATIHGVTESQARLSNKHTHCEFSRIFGCQSKSLIFFFFRDSLPRRFQNTLRLILS